VHFIAQITACLVENNNKRHMQLHLIRRIIAGLQMVKVSMVKTSYKL